MIDTVTIYFRDGSTQTITNAKLSHQIKSDSYWVRYNVNGTVQRMQIPRENIIKIHQENPEG